MLASDSPVPPQRILAWASRAAAGESRAWLSHVHGLAAYRAGDMENAKRAFKQSQGLPWESSGQLNELGLSLVAVREGQTKDARTRFDRARPMLYLPPAMQSHAGTTLLPDWLEFQILRPQIERALFDPPFPANPFAP